MIPTEAIAKRFAIRHGHEEPCEGCNHEANDAINALEEAGYRIVSEKVFDELVDSVRRSIGEEYPKNLHEYPSIKRKYDRDMAWLDDLIKSPDAAQG